MRDEKDKVVFFFCCLMDLVCFLHFFFFAQSERLVVNVFGILLLFIIL